MGNCTRLSSKSKVIEESVIAIPRQTEDLFSTDTNAPARLLTFPSKGSQNRVLLKISTIKNEDYNEAVGAKVSSREKTETEKIYIKKALAKHFLFNKLPSENLELVISKMKYYTLQPKSEVITQGKAGDCFFIVASGKLDVITDGIITGVLTKGQSFGELALMHDTPRPATIVAATFSNLWGITRKEFQGSIHTASNKTYQEIKIFISSIPMFDMLNPGEKEKLVEVLVPCEYEDGNAIVNEGDPGDVMYIIHKGIVRCMVKGKPVRDLQKGEFFGEQALLYDIPRSATCIAIKKVVLLSLHRENVSKVLGNQFQRIIYKNTLRISIEKSPALKDLTKKQMELLIENIKVNSYPAGTTLIVKGTVKGIKLLIVLKGNVSYMGKQHGLSCCIGDNDLLIKPFGKYEDSVSCVGDTDIAEISRVEIEKIIGGELKKIVEQNIILSILKQVQIFRTLPLQKLEVIISILLTKEYSKGQFIFKQGDKGQDFYIIKEGELEIIKDNLVIRTLEKYNYLGERAILFKDSRTASAKVKERANLWVLHKEDFLRVIDAGMRDQLIRRICLQDDTFNLTNIKIIKFLGRGTFGNVFLVLNTNNQTLYAIKSVSRVTISKFAIEDVVRVERKILLKLDHPFIVKLVRTFKDQHRIYYVLEYIRGIGFYETLRTLDLLRNEDMKFYIGCIILILEHMHERHIMYRDLKPENLMIDEEGYLKLIDFGTAKVSDGKTFTMVGTPQYIAPEVILGKGYTLSADLWSLGIVSYEIATGTVPFCENEQDPYKIYQKILEYNLVYPQTLKKNPRIKIFIDQLLNLNPLSRGTAESLKAHKWFTGYNWEGLFSKHLKPPHLPIIDNFNTENYRSEFGDKSIQGIFAEQEALIENIDEASKIRERTYDENWDEDF